MRIALRALGHHYAGGAWLFRGVEREIISGAITVVTGPSGSGKSTLLAIIAGLVRPAEGAVEAEQAGEAHWVLQQPVALPRRSAAENVMLPLLGRGEVHASASIQALVALERFGLSRVAHRRFAELSGGEAQRLTLARASVMGGGLLLVDEPTAQLDRSSADQVAAVLGELSSAGRVVVVATHDPALIDRADVVVELGGA